MLFVYQTIEDNTVCRDSIEEGCWINLVNPTEAEIQKVMQDTGLMYDFLKYPLDDEEIPRVEVADDQIMIIINVPIICKGDVMYDTIPLGIIHNDDYVVTVCLEDVNLLQEFASSRVKGMATFKKTRFIFQLFHRKTNLYLKYLRDIHRRTNEVELELHKSMRNKELINLLNLEKSLVFFTTSLRSNSKVMEKLMRSKFIKMYEEDEDLLEDVIIENAQAIEMADIYSNILSGTMDAFASIISNNLNIVMKFLAGITIILAIPTMVSSFWGMNVPVPFANQAWGFPAVMIIASIACVVSIILLSRRGML